MMSDSSIPVLSKPVDAMEAGPNGNNLEVAARQRHPIDEMQQQQALQRTHFVGSEEAEEARRMYGRGMAMELALERRFVQQNVSLVAAGMPSSNLSMDILTGDDMKLGFEQVLGRPENQPVVARHQADPHAVMERQLGMTL